MCFCCILFPLSANLHLAIRIACSTNPHCLVSQSPNNSIHASFICRPFAISNAARCIGKLSVFISVHQFEEIFSALIDSAVGYARQASFRRLFFSLCVALLGGGTGRYRYSDGSQRGPGPLCSPERRNRACWRCRYRGGDNNPGVAGTNYIHQLYQ